MFCLRHLLSTHCDCYTLFLCLDFLPYTLSLFCIKLSFLSIWRTCARPSSLRMPPPPGFHYRIVQLFVLFLICTTSSLAITEEQLANIFTLHSPATSPGGCSRTLPNGVNMLSHTVTAFTDAFTMAAAVQSEIKSFRFDTPAAGRLRSLLFLFFGITFGDQNQVNAEKARDYIYVQGAEPALTTSIADRLGRCLYQHQ